MGAYYYLASQLPYLIYGQTPPMSSEAFKELAKPMLSKRDTALLEMVSPDPCPPELSGEGPSYSENAPSSGSVFINSWREWERTFRLNLARHRSAKLHWEGSAPVTPPTEPTDAVTAASRIAGLSESPLELEQHMDRERWDVIDGLQGLDTFSSSSVFAYLLKLMLLERHASFQADKGFIEYKSLYASIVGGVVNNGDTK